MTTYVLSGFTVRDNGPSVAPDSFYTVTGAEIRLVVPDGRPFTYSPLEVLPNGEVRFTPDTQMHGLPYAPHLLPEDMISLYRHTLSEITWPGGTAVVLKVDSTWAVSHSDVSYYLLSGDPLPQVESYADYAEFTASITSIEPVTAGLQTGQTLDWDLNAAGVSENDILTGTDQADRLKGGEGNDRIEGGHGDDLLKGGNHRDTLLGQEGRDLLFGGNGNDILRGGADNDYLAGGGGRDILKGGDGEDTLLGRTGSDTLSGGRGNDALKGGAGDDILFGGHGNDTLRGGAGDDVLSGGHGDDTLRGGTGDNSLSGGRGDDVNFGGRGNDTLSGGAGDDALSGGDGDDYLSGGSFTQNRFLSPFSLIVAAPTHDMILEDIGSDTLDGGLGQDTLDGGLGDDLLTGGADDDLFVFWDGFGSFGNDTITDFDASSSGEKIDLSTVSSIEDMTDLLENHIREDGANVIIEDGAGSSITLENVDLADLDGTDFIFELPMIPVSPDGEDWFVPEVIEREPGEYASEQPAAAEAEDEPAHCEDYPAPEMEDELVITSDYLMDPCPDVVWHDVPWELA